MENKQPDPVDLNLQLRQFCEQLPTNSLKRGDFRPEDLGLQGNLKISMNPEWAAEEGVTEQDLIDDIVMCFADMREKDRRAKSEISLRLLDIFDQKLLPFSRATEPCNWYIRYTISELSVRGVDENNADRLWFLAKSGSAGVFSIDPSEVSEMEERGVQRIRKQISSGEGRYIMDKVDGELKLLNMTSLELSSQHDQWISAYQQKYGTSLV